MNEQGGKVFCTDPIALNAWYVVGVVDEIPPGTVLRTRLLDTPLMVARAADGGIAAEVAGAEGTNLPVREKFGYVWTTLGDPPAGIFDIPEYDEPDRRNMNAASFGVRTSAPRVVENFLDMGHFAFVHTDYLGVEPHTQIKAYKTAVSAAGDEVVATECFAYQPLASIAASEGFDVEYAYRVPHPYCAILYKSCVLDPTRRDVIAIFLQPTSEETVIAHMMLSVLDDTNSDLAIRGYQQLIFGQDKPIVENQLPKRLPLDMRSELSVRADASSAAYRRWLSERGVQYGTIPA